MEKYLSNCIPIRLKLEFESKSNELKKNAVPLKSSLQIADEEDEETEFWVRHLLWHSPLNLFSYCDFAVCCAETASRKNKWGDSRCRWILWQWWCHWWWGKMGHTNIFITQLLCETPVKFKNVNDFYLTIFQNLVNLHSADCDVLWAVMFLKITMRVWMSNHSDLFHSIKHSIAP